MGSNVYINHGRSSEQNLIEDLIIESISIYGQTFLYIPRTLVAKDEILGEDRLSKFEHAYPIDMYLENVNGFEGQGAFIDKFGLFMQQSATLTVARRSWDRFIGRYGKTILPNRPNEGDLLYFPLTKGLFEIKFVQHQDPFYQLQKLYVYKLEVELFQYSSESMDTGVDEIDIFEDLKTTDVSKQADVEIPHSYGDNNEFKNEALDIIFKTGNKFGNVELGNIRVDSSVIYADSTDIKADRG